MTIVCLEKSVHHYNKENAQGNKKGYNSRGNISSKETNISIKNCAHCIQWKKIHQSCFAVNRQPKSHTQFCNKWKHKKLSMRCNPNSRYNDIIEGKFWINYLITKKMNEMEGIWEGIYINIQLSSKLKLKMEKKYLLVYTNQESNIGL